VLLKSPLTPLPVNFALLEPLPRTSNWKTTSSPLVPTRSGFSFLFKSSIADNRKPLSRPCTSSRMRLSPSKISFIRFSKSSVFVFSKEAFCTSSKLIKPLVPGDSAHLSTLFFAFLDFTIPQMQSEIMRTNIPNTPIHINVVFFIVY